jgi:predicted molibdopterin-dependent oxidoreductase YjgC
LQLVLPSPEPGWAGGSVRVPRVCVDQALAVVDACDPSLSESAHTRLETSCRDSVISTVLD